jgi:ABC-2 type transport system ATP-binding protein
VDLAAENLELLRQSLETLTGVQSIAGHDNILTVTCTTDLNATELNRFCFDKGIVLNHLSLKRKTLEKRFLEITGNTSDR